MAIMKLDPHVLVDELNSSLWRFFGFHCQCCLLKDVSCEKMLLLEDFDHGPCHEGCAENFIQCVEGHCLYQQHDLGQERYAEESAEGA